MQTSIERTLPQLITMYMENFQKCNRKGTINEDPKKQTSLLNLGPWLFSKMAASCCHLQNLPK